MSTFVNRLIGLGFGVRVAVFAMIVAMTACNPRPLPVVVVPPDADASSPALVDGGEPPVVVEIVCDTTEICCRAWVATRLLGCDPEHPVSATWVKACEDRRQQAYSYGAECLLKAKSLGDIAKCHVHCIDGG